MIFTMLVKKRCRNGRYIKMAFLALLDNLSIETRNSCGGILVPIYNLPLYSLSREDNCLLFEKLQLTPAFSAQPSHFASIIDSIGNVDILGSWLALKNVSQLIFHMMPDESICPVAAIRGNEVVAIDPLDLPPIAQMTRRILMLAPDCKKDRLALEFYNDSEFGKYFRYAILFSQTRTERIFPVHIYDDLETNGFSDPTLDHHVELDIFADGPARQRSRNERSLQIGCLTYENRVLENRSACTLTVPCDLCRMCPGTVIFKWESCLSIDRHEVCDANIAILRIYRSHGWKIVVVSDALPIDHAYISPMDTIAAALPEDIDAGIYFEKPGKRLNNCALHDLLHEIFTQNDGLPLIVYSADCAELASTSSMGITQGIEVITVHFSVGIPASIKFCMRDKICARDGIVMPKI